MSAPLNATPPTQEVVPLVEAFLVTLGQNEGLATSTLDAYRFDMTRLAHWLGTVPVHRATEVQLRQYLFEMHSRGVKIAATRRALLVFRRFYRWAALEQLCTASPAASLTVPRMASRKASPLGASYAEALLNVCRKGVAAREQLRDQAMLALAYGAGLPVPQVLRLRLNELDLRQGLVNLQSDPGRPLLLTLPVLERVARYVKHGRPQYVKDAAANDIVFLSRLGLPISPSGFWRQLKALAESAGLDSRQVLPSVLRTSFLASPPFGLTETKNVR